MRYADELIDLLIALVLFGALFPVITEQINNIGLDAINVSGTVRNFSWAGYVIVILVLFGVVYLAMNQYKNKKK